MDMLRHFHDIYDGANDVAELVVIPEMLEE
jgi:hypothetical protein